MKSPGDNVVYAHGIWTAIVALCQGQPIRVYVLEWLLRWEIF